MTAKTKNVRLLKLLHVSDSAIFLWPVLILYYYKVAGSAAGAGVLLATMAIVSALAELPTGIFSDHYGRARTTQTSTIFNMISASLLVAAWWYGFWLLMISVVVGGIAQACESGNHDSLMYESSDDQIAFKKASAWKEVAGPIASMVTAVLGSVMGSKSLLLAAVASLLPRFVSLIASLGVVDIEKHNLSKGQELRRLKATFHDLKLILFDDKATRWLSLGKIIQDGFGEVSWQYRALFVKTVWPVWAIGLSMPLSNASNAIGGYIAHRYAGRKGDPAKTLVATVGISRSLTTAAYAMSNVFSPVIIGLVGLLYPLGKISFISYLHDKLHVGNRASTFSAISLLSTLLYAAGSVACGALIDVRGVHFTLVIVAACGLPSTICYWRSSVASRKLA